MKRDEREAHAQLSATSKLRSLDVLHGEIQRERRKASVGRRRPECTCGALMYEEHKFNCPRRREP
jgi:hypothetical protein